MLQCPAAFQNIAAFESQYLLFDLLVVFTMLTCIFSHGFFSTNTVVVIKGKKKTRFEDIFYKIFNRFNMKNAFSSLICSSVCRIHMACMWPCSLNLPVIKQIFFSLFSFFFSLCSGILIFCRMLRWFLETIHADDDLFSSSLQTSFGGCFRLISATRISYHFLRPRKATDSFISSESVLLLFVVVV